MLSLFCVFSSTDHLVLIYLNLYLNYLHINTSRFMNEIIENFKKVLFSNYSNFEGRARRSEYWLFHLAIQSFLLVLALPIIFFVFFFLIRAVHQENLGGTLLVVFCIIFAIILICSLAILIPSLAVSVRRLHDIDKSGWWLCLSLIPLGPIVVMYFLVLDGNPHPNRYGQDPKEAERKYYEDIVAQQRLAANLETQSQTNSY